MSGLLARLDGVALHAVRLPDACLVAAVRAADDAHLARHHERAVEADAELADDVGDVGVREVVLVLELLAAGMRDGAEVLLQLFGGHADAVVGHGDRAGVLVERHVNFQVVLAELDAVVGQAAEIQLVDRVGRVADELAEEDLAVRVDGVDHEVQKFLAFGFELAHVRRFPFTWRGDCRLAVPAFEC